MKKLTLAQIGRRLVRAYRELTPEQRKSFSFDAVMARLHTPVGALPKREAN